MSERGQRYVPSGSSAVYHRSKFGRDLSRFTLLRSVMDRFGFGMCLVD